METNTNVRVRCADCRFARLVKDSIDKRRNAYECGNPNSEYSRALLNVTLAGDMQNQITWSGCVNGKRRCSA